MIQRAENNDPLADRNVRVAKFDGTCVFCAKPTKSAKSLTYLRAHRRYTRFDGRIEWVRACAHFDCYDSPNQLKTQIR